MDIEFFEPSKMPVSPEETRIEGIWAEAYPDGRRVKVQLEVTPFQVRPNLEVRLLDPQGELVAEAMIIEATEPVMMITMHLRGQVQGGRYTVVGRLSFEAPQEVFHELRQELGLPASERRDEGA